MQQNRRVGELAALTSRPGLEGEIERYAKLSAAGLTRMFMADRLAFPQTARLSRDGGLVLEGGNTRYGAIAALGLGRLGEDRQREVLAGHTACELVGAVIPVALAGDDPGAVALAAWAGVELGAELTGEALHRVVRIVDAARPIPTVDLAWALTALVAAAGAESDNSASLTAAAAAARRLLRAQGEGGIFPHVLPPATQSRLRAHVGCFADQVYPIQALARYAALTGDTEALSAANRCASRICRLQGDQGQWWWHYDARNGDVVEGFPVYSVHQHAMAPMALYDLLECGGDDHRREIALGLRWIAQRPETAAPLVAESLGVIWRKVGRREPRKLVRGARSALTAIRPGLRLEPLDLLFPPGPVDHECRPYELGWLLYVWATTRDREPSTAPARDGVSPLSSPRPS
jgi:hypothetical protein